MSKNSNVGISSYYRSLPRGEKDEFVREVAEALFQSTSNISLKMRTGRWPSLQVGIVESIIAKRQGK